MSEPDDPGRSGIAPHADALAGSAARETAVHVLALAAGSVADLIAFKDVLALLVQGSEVASWALALGAALLACTAAAWTGEKLAEVLRGMRHALPFAIIAGLSWLALGAALVVVRWTVVTPSLTGFDQSAALAAAHQRAVMNGWFFGALYLVSGIGVALVSMRLTDPYRRAFRRAQVAVRRQEVVVAESSATVDRARNVVAHHIGEFDRDLARRNQAIADRRALGAEASNYARILMAQQMGDPRKTGVTESGPIPGQARQVPPAPQPEGNVA
ncbi:hypothetical protein [Nocardia sp. NPDC057227]|uniref:hypothetical protein n=1 Tax=Nocardia sp. NPDC057227 TaxID=3346056 RepID=UPI00363DE75C